MRKTSLGMAALPALVALAGCASAPVPWQGASLPRGSRVAVAAYDPTGRLAEPESGAIERTLSQTGLQVVDRSTAGLADYLLVCELAGRECEIRLMRIDDGAVVGACRTRLSPDPLTRTLRDIVQVP